MPDAETGPWWVLDKETGHKFVAHTLGDHLEVQKDESPYLASGEYRPAEPNAQAASKKGAGK
jgi:hypothetical protein